MDNKEAAEKFAESMLKFPIFDKNKGKWILTYKKPYDDKVYTTEYDTLSSVCAAYGAKYTYYRNLFLNNKIDTQRS